VFLGYFVVAVLDDLDSSLKFFSKINDY